jgi:hypothetical protein
MASNSGMIIGVGLGAAALYIAYRSMNPAYANTLQPVGSPGYPEGAVFGNNGSPMVDYSGDGVPALPAWLYGPSTKSNGAVYQPNGQPYYPYTNNGQVAPNGAYDTAGNIIGGVSQLVTGFGNLFDLGGNGTGAVAMGSPFNPGGALNTGGGYYYPA